MKLYHYFAIGLKLLSVALIIYGLRFIPNIIEIFRYETLSGVAVTEYYIVIQLAVILLVAGILWVFPITLARSFLKPEMDLTVESIGTSGFLAAFIAAIGLFIFTYGLIDISFWAIYWNMSSINPHFSDADTHAQNIANTIATVFQLVVSFLLMYKCRTVAIYINKVAK